MFKEHDVISSWAVLGLVDIKMKFQAASTFWLQLVQGLCSCGQKFSSEAGICCKKQDRNVYQAFICIFSGNWKFGDSVIWQNYSLNC